MKLITIQMVLDSVRSLKDKSWKVTFETNELTPEQTTFLGSHLQSWCTLAIKPGESKFEQESLDMLDKYDEFPDKKSQAQRIRGVLYRLWELDPQGFKVFNDFYVHKTEQIINHLKKKLP